MPGLDPGIHLTNARTERWIAGSSPAMTAFIISPQFVFVTASWRGRSQPPQRNFLAIDGSIVWETGCQTTRGASMGYVPSAAESALGQTVPFLNKSFASVP